MWDGESARLSRRLLLIARLVTRSFVLYTEAPSQPLPPFRASESVNPNVVMEVFTRRQTGGSSASVITGSSAPCSLAHFIQVVTGRAAGRGSPRLRFCIAHVANRDRFMSHVYSGSFAGEGTWYVFCPVVRVDACGRRGAMLPACLLVAAAGIATAEAFRVTQKLPPAISSWVLLIQVGKIEYVLAQL